MAGYVTQQIARRLVAGGKGDGARILVLGLAFKENVPDLRNSKVADVIKGLKSWGFAVDVHDPLAYADEAMHEYGIALLPDLDKVERYDCIVGAVAHKAYADFGVAQLTKLVAPDGLIADIKGMWRTLQLPPGIDRWAF
jgi:UDP-N-acetyl-D-galactosamine dehydrogenase